MTPFSSFYLPECSESSDTFYTASDWSEADEDMITASEGTDEPEFIEAMASKYVEEGCAVKFECVVKGHPQPTVDWIHNRKMIKDCETYQIRQDGNR